MGGGYIIMFMIFSFIHPYGCCISLGIILCLIFNLFIINRKDLLSNLSNILFYVYCGAFFCGKIFFIVELIGISLISVHSYILPSMLSIIRGGFCILGASFGGVIGVFYAIKKYNYKKSDFTILPISILLIHMCGRIGCYYANCCNGKVFLFSLYPVVICYYFTVFIFGLIIYYSGFFSDISFTMMYYGFSVFFERFVFDFFREDAVFIYFPLTYYHIASICYIILIFLIVKKYSDK